MVTSVPSSLLCLSLPGSCRWEACLLGVFLLNSNKLSSSFLLSLFFNSPITKTENPKRGPWFSKDYMAALWGLPETSDTTSLLLFSSLVGREDKPATALWDSTRPCSEHSWSTSSQMIWGSKRSLSILQDRLELTILLPQLQLLAIWGWRETLGQTDGKVSIWLFLL